MKKVVITPPVQVALRSLDEDDRRRVHSWFDRLANWDEDRSVRNHSHSLEDVPGVYFMKTSTDLRLFFKVDPETITILDVATRQSIVTSGQSPEAE